MKMKKVNIVMKKINIYDVEPDDGDAMSHCRCRLRDVIE